MNEPWGISGPQFLRLYLVALIIAAVWAGIVRLRMRQTTGGQPPQPLTVDEFAYLAAGPRRVVEASVARLLESGALRVSRAGALRATGKTAGSAVDQAVLAEVGDGSSSVSDVLTRAARYEAVRSCGERLVALGLSVGADIVRAKTRLALVPLLVVGVVGVLRLMNGFARGAPVGWLILLLVLTAVSVLIAGHRPTPLRTVLGNRVLRQARYEGPKADSGIPFLAGTAALAGAAGLVAFGGLSVFPDPEISASLRHTSAASSSSSGGGGGGDGGGGDGGGGGGCGGGCGGGG